MHANKIRCLHKPLTMALGTRNPSAFPFLTAPSMTTPLWTTPKLPSSTIYLTPQQSKSPVVFLSSSYVKSLRRSFIDMVWTPELHVTTSLGKTH